MEFFKEPLPGETIMCQGDSYFTHFCGCSDSDCQCRDIYARTRPCLNAACSKMFRSSCGAQLFCGKECQDQSELGQKIRVLIESGKIAEIKKERRRLQVREADKKYRQTENGKEHRRAQRSRNYRRQREKLKGEAGEGARSR